MFQQIGKSGREKSAIHYHKVVKAQDTVPKVGKVFKTPTSSGPSPQTTPAGINVQQAKQDKYVPSFISRKRPAAPSNPLSPSKRARRRLEPRIILRIFKDNNEWNVEQGIYKCNLNVVFINFMLCISKVNKVPTFSHFFLKMYLNKLTDNLRNMKIF